MNIFQTGQSNFIKSDFLTGIHYYIHVKQNWRTTAHACVSFSLSVFLRARFIFLAEKEEEIIAFLYEPSATSAAVMIRFNVPIQFRKCSLQPMSI